MDVIAEFLFSIPLLISSFILLATGLHFHLAMAAGAQANSSLGRAHKSHTRPSGNAHTRRLPSSPSGTRFFPESINWAFRLDRELNALERQRGMRVPYSQRKLSLVSSEEVLNRFSRRVEALEGSHRSSPSPS